MPAQSSSTSGPPTAGARLQSKPGASNEQALIHPYVLAVAPVLFFYSVNIHHYDFPALVRPLLIVMAMMLISWRLLGRIAGRKKAALLVGYFLFMFFAHGYINDVAEIMGYQLVTDGLSWGEVKFLGPYFALFAGGIWFLATRGNLYPWTYLMNLAACFMLLPALSQLAPLAYKRLSNELSGGNYQLDLAPPPKQTPSEKPDIYFIILDSYGRSDVLKEFYGYDDSHLIGYLKKRGFSVSQSSASNYTFTSLSISSTLNYAYYDEETRAKFRDFHDWQVPRLLFQSNRVARFLKQMGYSIVALNSQYDTLNYRNADIFMGKWWFASVFELGFIERTPLPWFLRKVGWPVLQDWHRAMAQYSVDALPQTVSFESPKFVYCHVLLPHPPLLFGPHGEEVNPARRYEWKGGLAYVLTPGGIGEIFRKGYRDQVAYIGSLVPAIIEEILAKSESPPIIILQSDHGPPGVPEVTLADEISRRAEFAILSAMYLPNGGETAIYEGMSPVNTFRAIFNYYFGTQHPLLEDRYYLVNRETPFDQVRYVKDGKEFRILEESMPAD